MDTDVEMISTSVGEAQSQNVATSSELAVLETNLKPGDAEGVKSVKTESSSCPMEVDPTPIVSQDLGGSLSEPKEIVDQTANDSDNTKYPKVSVKAIFPHFIFCCNCSFFLLLLCFFLIVI
jgi:hypothetical protein